MELRSILKKCMLDFFLIQAGITFAIGVIECIGSPASGAAQYIFFMPFVYAFFCVIPSIVVCSSKELSIKQMLVRKAIHFALIELIVMLISYKTGVLASTFMRIAIPLSAAAVYIMVNVFEYLFCKLEADIMTKKIQCIREKGDKKAEC